jgi:peptide/nickel transport system substrate-binding protein
MSWKPFSAALALLLTVVILAACAAPAAQPGAADAPAAPDAGAAASGPVTGGTLTMSFGEDFVTFHPYFDVTNSNFKPIFYEAPLRINDEGGFEPWLAESYEVSEDGLTVTLTLRQGIRFHNGREVTADDVVWAVEHARNTELGHHLSDRFQTATGATKIDDYTVTINYSEQTQSKLDGIARLYLFPQEALETIETTPVGTGPFQFVEWTPGEQLVAERFEEYWQEGQPYLDQIVIRPLPDPQSRLVNLQSGSIDFLLGVPLADVALLRQQPDLVIGKTPPGFAFYAFLMNVNAPPFDNTMVRQAMNYALDREKIRETVFYNEVEPATLPYAESSWAYAPDLANAYPFDLERAKELLTEAGYPDGFETQMLIRGPSGPHLDMAQIYQQDLATIGVNVELVPTELPQYWPQLFESQFTIVSHSTGDATVDPSGAFEGAACCRPFRNFFGITENQEWFPEYEEVILQARDTQDQAQRTELYHRALEIFVEQGWTIPVVWEQNIYAYRNTVQGVRTDQEGLLWLGEAWVGQ